MTMPEPAPRRTLVASPAMRARLGLVEAPPAAPSDDPMDHKTATEPLVISQKATGEGFNPAEKAARLAAVREVEALLREHWPVAFCVSRPPLAVGIREPDLRGRRRCRRFSAAWSVPELVDATIRLPRRDRPRRAAPQPRRLARRRAR
jgi:hypothetical protein